MKTELVVGVTGHRVLAHVEKIEAGVDAALTGLERLYPGCSMTVVSSLAEGADRLVARRALNKPGSRLVVVLPLAREAYLEDFETEESRRDFLMLLESAHEVVNLPAQPTREAAYEAAGMRILDRADVLLTVWDGREAQGRGGTAEVVSRARARRLPLAWVHAGNRKAGTLEPTSLGATQGEVTFENMSAPR